MKTVDADTDEEVQRRDLVKGYEFRKNQYLLLNDEDLDSVRVESSSMMNIEKFVEIDSIDPIYYNSSYYDDVSIGHTNGKREHRRLRALAPARSRDTDLPDEGGRRRRRSVDEEEF